MATLVMPASIEVGSGSTFVVCNTDKIAFLVTMLAVELFNM